jgi:hypothetical protein
MIFSENRIPLFGIMRRVGIAGLRDLTQAPKGSTTRDYSIEQGFGVTTQNSTGIAKALEQNHQTDAFNFKNSCNDNRDPRRLNLCNAILSQHYSVCIHPESSINSHK